MFRFGITRVFDGDDKDGANNANVNGGKADGDNKATGGGDGDNKNKVETYTVKIDGEDRNLSIDELKTLASKSGGADQRFQAAADATKAAERGTRIETLVKAISKEETPSEADVRELAGLLEIEPAEFMQYLKEGDPPQKTDNKTGVADFNTEFKKQMGATPAEVRATLEFSTQRHVNDARKEIREISDKAVDKDSIIGKMIVGEDKDDVLATIKDMVAEDVLQKIQNGVPFGAEMVTATVQMVRSKLTKLGIPKRLNQQPIVLGLGPGAGISSEIQADEPIKRIPSNEDDGEKNLISRYLQKAVHAARKIK